jgi:cell division septation protein DedD
MDARSPDAAVSQPEPLDNPDAADPVSTATPLGNDGGVVTAPLAGSTPASGTTAPAAAMFPAPTAGGDFAVNFGAFSTVAVADRIVASLRASQLPGYRESAIVDGKTVQRVRIGPYATRAEAEAARLRAAHVRDDVGAKVVALDADASTKPTAAAPAATTAATRPAEPAKPAAPAPKPVAASDTGFAVQLAAFSKAADATALRDRLRSAGFSAFTEAVSTDKGTLTRVRVGPVLNRAEAEQLKVQVKSKVGIDGIVRPHP